MYGFGLSHAGVLIVAISLPHEGWKDLQSQHNLTGVKQTDVPPMHTMAMLGNMGRFGNQVFQYAFLRLCAKASGTAVQCSPWVGRDLFGHDDPPVSVAMPPLFDTGVNMNAFLEVLPELRGFVSRLYGAKPGYVPDAALTVGCEPAELIGLFQWHSSAYRPHREVFRSLFQPQPDLQEWLHEPLRIMRERGKTIVAIHLRVGDYRWLPQYSWTLVVHPRQWVEWLDKIWPTLDNPVLYICSDEVASVRHWFGKFNPVTAEEMTVGPPARLRNAKAGFYLDYHVMTQADVLGASNSSFSFSAAMLNERASLFARPSWDGSLKFVEFDPWDSEVLMRVARGRRASRKSYSAMLRIAHESGGYPEALITALLYHPVGAAATLAIRLKLARLERWKRFRKNILRR